jgi:UDP-glucuronate 4-epimerase
MKVLITGTAGFIGFHLVNKLAIEGFDITGIDNINDYYDVSLKYARLEEAGIEITRIKKSDSIQSKKFENYRFIKLDVTDKAELEKLFREQKFDYVIHLAAQAGVRYSLENPQAYIDSNITGFFNILDACRECPPRHLIFASSSSVYGNNTKVPFSTDDNTDNPVSLYAATKKSNEVMAYAYSSLYNIPMTGLRFFTVYGPWGRPDMAYFSFAKNIMEGKPIKVFAEGKLKRDFTYINDITEILYRLISIKPNADDSGTKFEIYNIGNDNPVTINEFILLLEKYLGKKAIKEYLPMQKGDVLQTHAEISELTKITGYRPVTKIEKGLQNFCEWFLTIKKNQYEN